MRPIVRHALVTASLTALLVAGWSRPAWAVMAFQESGGQVVMEAENPDANTSRNGKTWTLGTSQAGFAGSGYLTALPNTGTIYGSASTAMISAPELQFNVNFATTGTYYIWVRGYAAVTADDALHAGIDGTAPASSDKIKLTATGAWNWTKTDTTTGVVSLAIASAGLHTIHVWMNEDGLSLDKLILTTSSAFTPSGTGPAQSQRVTVGGDTTPPVISAVGASNLTTSGATITWTTNETATSQVEYGPTTSYGQLTTLDSTLVTGHSVALSGLSAGTLYHYRVRSKDAANNEAIGSDATFTTQTGPDTTPPTGSISVNSGAAATNSTSVTLTLSASDASGVAQMQFSNDGTSYSAAEAYATTKAWTLTSGDGTKTVYVKYKDTVGNWSGAFSDQIALDTTAPTVTITSPSNNAVVMP